MSVWAVGFISFHDNDLTIEIVQAPDWQSALSLHSKMKDDPVEYDSDDIESVKQDFFDCDCMFDVKLITE